MSDVSVRASVREETRPFAALDEPPDARFVTALMVGAATSAESPGQPPFAFQEGEHSGIALFIALWALVAARSEGLPGPLSTWYAALELFAFGRLRPAAASARR